MSGNSLQWRHGLLVITADTSVDDSQYAPQEWWSLPPATIKSYLVAALETVAGTGRTAIRVTSSPLPGTIDTAWTVECVGYQGAAPSPLIWSQLPLTSNQVNSLIESPLPSATYRLRLVAREAGKSPNYFPEVSLTTTGDTALSDNILSPAKKPPVVQNYNVIIGEQAGIGVQADAYTVSRTAYDAAVSALTAYLGTLTGWNVIPGSDVVIVGTTFRQKFADVYTTRQALLNAIYAAAKALADAAQATANSRAKIFYQGTTPTALAVGDIWINTASNYQMSTWTGAVWQLSQDSAAALASAATANSAIADITSDNKLTGDEKPAIRLDWDIAVTDKTSLDAQATAFAVTTEATAYDSAFQTLATYLNAGTAWVSGIPTWIADANLGTTTTIVGATFRANWSTYFSAKQTLINAISTKAKALADAAQNTGNQINSVDYLANQDKIQLRRDWDAEQLIKTSLDAQAAAYSTSYDNAVAALSTNLIAAGAPAGWATAWPDGTAFNAAGIVNSLRGWWSNIASARVALQKTITDTIQNNAAYADSLARSSNNLVKNGNTSNATPTVGTPEAAGIYTYATSTISPGGYARLAVCDATGAVSLYISAYVPCVAGDQFYFTGQGLHGGGAVHGSMQMALEFYDSAKALIGAATYSAVGTSVSPATPSTMSLSSTAPSLACYVRFYARQSGAANGNYIFINNFYATRMISAGMFEADLGIIGVIRSSNYVAGSTGNAPVGYKTAGTAFTTTYSDGTTDATCQMELGGSANFGGRKVQTVNDRLFQTFNRIGNGVFAYSLAPWGASGTDLPTWISTSYAAGSGSGTLTASAPPSTFASKTGSLYQTFAIPKLAPGQVVNLVLQTGFKTSAATTTNYTGYVTVYLMNFSTGTETNIGSYTYTYSSGATLTTLTWTPRTITLTTNLANGGDFALRLEMNAAANNTSAVGADQSASTYVDEVSILG